MTIKQRGLKIIEFENLSIGTNTTNTLIFRIINYSVNELPNFYKDDNWKLNHFPAPPYKV